MVDNIISTPIFLIEYLKDNKNIEKKICFIKKCYKP